MGNVLASQPYNEEDREKLCRLFGVRMANEGDDKTMHHMHNTRRAPARTAGYGLEARVEPENGHKPTETAMTETRNVMAAAAPATAASPMPPVPAAAAPPSQRGPPPAAAAAPAVLPRPQTRNPGTIADLHRHCRDIQPTTFEGLKVILSKGLSQSFGISHTMHMGRAQYSFYQFNAHYAGEGFHPVTKELYPTLQAELDANGNLNATVMNYVTARLRGKLHATIIGSRLVDAQLHADYLGEDFTCSCVLSNIDWRQRTGAIVASYLQEIKPKLSLGLELVYQADDDRPAGERAVLSAVGRYEEGSRQWSGMISMNSLDLCYSQCYGESVKAGVQMQADIWKQQAMARLGYQWCMPRSDFTFRGAINTRGVISAVCEKRLSPMPIHMVLSGKLNHCSNHFRFGLGMVLE